MRSIFSAILKIGLLYGAVTATLAQGPLSSSLRERASAAAREVRPLYEVYIAPTRMEGGSTSIQVGPDRWSARGYDLKTLIAQIYDIDIRQIDFSDADAAAARYDVTLVLPRDESQQATQHLLQEALQKRFKVAITPESRSMQVYVLTAPNGLGPALHRHGAPTANSNGLLKLVSLDRSESTMDEMDDVQQITYTGKDCSGISSGGISVVAGTISEFSRTLEPDLDRLLVDDTRLAGSYDFQIENYRNERELFQLLRDRFGLVVVPAQRDVVVLTVRPI